jgi:hypothetical protein
VNRLVLAALASVLATAFMLAGADARRVVHIPTLADLCPGNAEWSKVAECIKRHGAFKLARDEARVKLVYVTDVGRFGGLYVYMFNKQWQLRGDLRMWQETDLLGFEHIAFGKHRGYRVDTGVSMPTSYSFDGETSVPAVLRQSLTLVCFDDAFGCTQVMTACDLMFHGKAYFSFRGKLVYEARQLKIVGDRGNAGMYCVQPELVVSD